ncbi:MAG: hypothetical protein WCG45_01645 [bacterium]
MNIEQIEIGKFYNFRISHKRAGRVLAIGNGNCIVKSPFVEQNQLIDLKNITSGIPEIGNDVEFLEIGKTIYTKKSVSKSKQTVFFEYKKTNSYGFEEDNFIEVAAEDVLGEDAPSKSECFINIVLLCLAGLLLCFIVKWQIALFYR